MKRLFFLSPLLVVGACATPHRPAPVAVEPIAQATLKSAAVEAAVEAPTEPAREPAPLSAAEFYSKRIETGAIPVMASVDASDEAMATARDDLARLLAKAPRIRRNLEANHFEVHVSAYGHRLSELPEFRSKRGTLTKEGDDFDAHMEGGKVIGAITACTEGTLVPKDQGHCIHEMAHAIDANALQPALRERILGLWDKAMAATRWKGEYAATNWAEYFAEATRLWLFDPKRLEREDKDVFAFVRALYNDAIDPGPPPRMESVRPSPPTEEGQAKSRASRLPVRVRVTNATSEPLRLQWLDYEGKRDRRPWSPTAVPGETTDLTTFAGHWFVATTLDGRAIATFAAPGSDALVVLP
jgi:hypothetical protein